MPRKTIRLTDAIEGAVYGVRLSRISHPPLFPALCRTGALFREQRKREVASPRMLRRPRRRYARGRSEGKLGSTPPENRSTSQRGSEPNGKVRVTLVPHGAGRDQLILSHLIREDQISSHCPTAFAWDSGPIPRSVRGMR